MEIKQQTGMRFFLLLSQVVLCQGHLLLFLDPV